MGENKEPRDRYLDRERKVEGCHRSRGSTLQGRSFGCGGIVCSGIAGWPAGGATPITTELPHHWTAASLARDKNRDALPHAHACT
ncbi:hypothetical protein KQX54_009877 [Cotesia glomerata]|uniref:Uncharacterized protein n=1 Tax=Cotesia glomerata TaxID=32391 RepID=A0AAV7J0G4_COTGL|nr:hypothetical protein KQX54_009877 [Cotesia glomerata]